MSFMPAFMLPMCKSVEIESGMKPCLTAGAACRNRKLPPPCPTSKMMRAVALEQVLVHFTAVIEHRNGAEVCVRGDVTGRSF